jgi:hypothetical protein
MSRRRVSLEGVTSELAVRAPELAARVVADSRDRVAWTRARSRGITATDVASLTSDNAIARAADAKLMGSGFSGNAYTAHGRLREPEIAAWVAATHGIQPSSALFHAVVEKRHLATALIDELHRRTMAGRVPVAPPADERMPRQPFRALALAD